MRSPILVSEIRDEHDVVLVRQRARQIATLLGFDTQEQTRIATAVSEIARNAYVYARGGKAEYWVESNGVHNFEIRIGDSGKGIKDLDTILSGGYQSKTGMGIGILGSKRLMDGFSIESTAAGVRVVLTKTLPARSLPITKARISEIVGQLAMQPPASPLDEVKQQNRELLQALDALRARQDELANLNRELEDTNRGVVALYAELDEKADHLQRANEVKTRFLADMTHEFRTPLNSILSLSRLLLDRIDGPLNLEQERQVALIRKSADALSELVNDLLDLAKVEAGKIVVKAQPFQIDDLFAALRGMLKPLLAANSSVRLIIEEARDVPELETDEGKVSQILRNFMSNALKYTERGEVRVSARRDGAQVVFAVEDTGVGIAREDQARIFEEFTQVDSPLQKRHRGTGLGLPLARKLAELLGGRAWVESEPGVGSTFYASIPMQYNGPRAARYDVKGVRDATRTSVLVIEDRGEEAIVYNKCLEHLGYQPWVARDLKTARHILTRIQPDVVIADVMVDGEPSWDFISEIKADSGTAYIPIIVVTVLDGEKRALALGANAFMQKPIDCTALARRLEDVLARSSRKILLVDDNASARYVTRALLPSDAYTVLECSEGTDAFRLAKRWQPNCIVLDLMMPDQNGFDILRQLKTDNETATIPVVVHTANRLSPEERQMLKHAGVALFPKDSVVGAREEVMAALLKAMHAAGMRGDT